MVRNKQWAIMIAALQDPVPLVRTIAIQVLGSFTLEIDCVTVYTNIESADCRERVGFSPNTGKSYQLILSSRSSL